MKQDSPNWLILSYPRSGNHILRTFFEYFTCQPTLGCPCSPNDTPIYTRKPNATRKLIDILDHTPIAVKSHTSLDIWRHQKNAKIDEVVLITRDPVECISSHATRTLRKRWRVTDRVLDQTVDRELVSYLSTLCLFKNFDRRSRQHILFEDMVGDHQNEQKIAEVLSRVCQKTIEVNVEDIKKVTSLSLDSQQSLKKKNSRLKARVRSNVAKKISYAEVIASLET